MQLKCTDMRARIDRLRFESWTLPSVHPCELEDDEGVLSSNDNVTLLKDLSANMAEVQNPMVIDEKSSHPERKRSAESSGAEALLTRCRATRAHRPRSQRVSDAGRIDARSPDAAAATQRRTHGDARKLRERPATALKTADQPPTSRTAGRSWRASSGKQRSRSANYINERDLLT
ncbi:Protein of unknown function [Gryllus bimaculatus]|nr:Protein of unknown function [Gryllus bimaculatus]